MKRRKVRKVARRIFYKVVHAILPPVIRRPLRNAIKGPPPSAAELEAMRQARLAERSRREERKNYGNLQKKEAQSEEKRAEKSIRAKRAARRDAERAERFRKEEQKNFGNLQKKEAQSKEKRDEKNLRTRYKENATKVKAEIASIKQAKASKKPGRASEEGRTEESIDGGPPSGP